ncbi:MAG: A/G-specific adenine glycosylase [Candidatus Parcubacteria bacterium]|nr:A/G-specific adenine glycosylase [Burkholderiales bacterium]
MADFSRKLVQWQPNHGRHGLPWQGTRDPYRIWLSEIMLQQTQVAAVVPYYGRFLARFPDIAALARGSEDEVLQLWSGLGYYARGRNLLRAARQVAESGAFPDTVAEIQALPGVGPSTAAAIAAFAFGRRAAILDGNVKRVLARQFGVEGEKAQWALAQSLTPARDIETYTQALMDLGATVCTRARPACGKCPVAGDCVARLEGRIDELPAARKRKPLPLKRSTWILLLHQGSVLLERRPGAGIWGGLWVLPEGPSKGVRAFCQQNFSCEIATTRRMTPIEHGFTHFRLNIQPIRCGVRRLLPRAQSPGFIWLDVAEAARAAVPAPVRKLLLGLV